MTTNDINTLKKQLGEKAFRLMYPQYTNVGTSKPVNKIVVKEPIHVNGLVFILLGVAEGKQTVTINFIRQITGWTVKNATAFVKEGEFPKVVTDLIVTKEELDNLVSESNINIF